MTELRADLVLEGGGVKGIAHAGAVVALAEAGYSFPRVAGSSAGALTAAVVAALQRAGEPVSRVTEVLAQLDYARLPQRSRLGSVPIVGPPLSLLAEDGLYSGDYLEDWLTGVLGELGVRTFADLLLPDEPGQAAPDGWASSLVVTASDLSRGRLVRVPWDLPAYGLGPDDLTVARAVRASTAVPFFFQPVRVEGATWVDGGLLSNFPVELFDRDDRQRPRWPTFGVRLTSRPRAVVRTREVDNPVEIGLAALEVLLTDQGRTYLEDPCTVVRTTFVDTGEVGVLDFGIAQAEADALYDAGAAAARAFLDDWDLDAYVRDCRS